MIELIEGGTLPAYQTKRAAAADCCARLDEELYLAHGIPQRVPLGFKITGMVKNEYALLLPRSGWALQGITLANSPGLIDSDYGQEVCAILINNGSTHFTVRPGDRVCQIMIQYQPRYPWFEQRDSERTGGFGSTGE